MKNGMIQIQNVNIPPKRIVFKSGFFVIRLWIGLILLNRIIREISPRTMKKAHMQLRRSIFPIEIVIKLIEITKAPIIIPHNNATRIVLNFLSNTLLETTSSSDKRDLSNFL